MIGSALRQGACGIQVRAVGSWSPQPPPYLRAIGDREFAASKEQWLKRTMMIGGMVPSYRIVAYFMVDALNWATMDCWPNHNTLADLAGTSAKTVQRAISVMEERNMLSVYRRAGSSHPLRYAPLYLVKKATDTDVPVGGQECPPKSDSGVHQSLLRILPQSCEVGSRLKKESKKDSGDEELTFNRWERGRLETQVAHLLGGFDILLRLAAIHDDIVTRICQAYHDNQLGPRQIKAARLAAIQTQAGS